jgi:TrmH family RNA methyltransferase
MSEKLYNDLSDKTDPSEMLVTAKIKHNNINDIPAKNPFLIVFDRPGDRGNFGSIVRSANAFNADGIFIIGHGIDIYDSKVIRASLGSVFFTKIAAVESMEVFLEYMKTQKKENNMEVIGTDSKGTVSATDYKIKRPVMVIVGNEAKGMSKNLKEICDKIIKIPINGNVNSLNVSCATSIIMWEVFKNDA